MNMTGSNHMGDAASTVDSLLHDSYLLVVELRLGGSANNSTDIWPRCVQQVEVARQRLQQSGLGERSVGAICLALCALLDETLLKRAAGDSHGEWAEEPLQVKFFKNHEAGVSLFEDMRNVLNEPAADPHVLTAFHRVLALGFSGGLMEESHPERLQLLAALEARVAPLGLDTRISTVVERQHWLGLPGWWSPMLSHGVAAGLLLAALWWGLDLMLGQQLASLRFGQA